MGVGGGNEDTGAMNFSNDLGSTTGGMAKLGQNAYLFENSISSSIKQQQ